MVDALAPWYDCYPERWQDQCSIARQLMQDVECGTDGDGLAFIRGTYRLLSNSGHDLGSFRVRIVFPAEFPKRNCHPRVYLESHLDQWPHGSSDLDSHIEDSGRLCLFVAMESGLDFVRKDELERLFPHVHSFLLKERLYQRDAQEAKQAGRPKPRWPGPERAHDCDGLLEAIRDSGQQLRRNDPCACGSGRKFKKCCLKKLEAHKRRKPPGTES